ncbi:MAG: glycerol dehydratase reactivase beta/small subunit family protein [Bacillota bacterium]
MRHKTDREKPSIHIYYHRNITDLSAFQEILWGIEEEGIPYDLQAKDHHDVQQLAYDACEASPLGVGFGIDDKTVVLHYVKLKKDRPLYQMGMDAAFGLMRILGVNGARLVKGIPFKDLEEEEDDGEMKAHQDIFHDPKLLEETVRAVVESVMARMKAR